VSECVKNLKGASSRAVNRSVGTRVFAWQEGYGSLTVGGRSLDKVIEYVRHQKHHHEVGTTLPTFERTENADRKSQAREWNSLAEWL